MPPLPSTANKQQSMTCSQYLISSGAQQSRAHNIDTFTRSAHVGSLSTGTSSDSQKPPKLTHFTYTKLITYCYICGSHSGECAEYVFVGCKAV
jgi:hypothetical protein